MTREDDIGGLWIPLALFVGLMIWNGMSYHRERSAFETNCHLRGGHIADPRGMIFCVRDGAIIAEMRS